MIIGRGDIRPPSTGQSSDDASDCNNSRKTRVWFSGEQVEKTNEGKSRARSDGNEQHEEGTFRISIADGRGDGWEPFLWISIPLILNYLFVMKSAANKQGAEKGSIRNGGMTPRDEFSIKLMTSEWK